MRKNDRLPNVSSFLGFGTQPVAARPTSFTAIMHTYISVLQFFALQSEIFMIGVYSNMEWKSL